MATVADIERLKALTDRLLPLSSRARGEVIAADDWNAVVGALLEIARAVVAGGSTDTAVPEHDHPDQVALGWLDPRLRRLIERGPLADPASTSRVTAMERQAMLIGRHLDEVSSQIRDLRVVTNRQETNDLDRTSAMTVLSRTVSGLKDPRNEISDLRATLDAIGANVSAVSTFAAGLGDVTPAEMLAGLTKVDQLQERLTTPTGTVLDAAEFERRLAELRTTLVTEDELTAAIKSRPARLTDAAKAKLLDETKVAAQRQAEDSATVLTEALRTQLTTRIEAVAQSAVQAARAATADFRDELKTTITDQLTEVIEQGQRATRDRLQSRVEEAKTSLQTAVDDRVTRLEQSLRERVSLAIEDARPDILAELSSTLDDRLRGVDDRFTTLQNSIGEIRTGLTGTTTDLANIRQTVVSQVDTQIATLRSEIASERDRVDTALADVRSEIPPASEGITREELLREIARNNDTLRSDIQSTVTTRIRTQLQEGLAGHFQFVEPGAGGEALHLEPGQRFILRPVETDNPFG
jgi:archaellum component FlaC